MGFARAESAAPTAALLTSLKWLVNRCVTGCGRSSCLRACRLSTRSKACRAEIHGRSHPFGAPVTVTHPWQTSAADWVGVSASPYYMPGARKPVHRARRPGLAGRSHRARFRHALRPGLAGRTHRDLRSVALRSRPGVPAGATGPRVRCRLSPLPRPEPLPAPGAGPAPASRTFGGSPFHWEIDFRYSVTASSSSGLRRPAKAILVPFT